MQGQASCFLFMGIIGIIGIMGIMGIMGSMGLMCKSVMCRQAYMPIMTILTPYFSILLM